MSRQTPERSTESTPNLLSPAFSVRSHTTSPSSIPSVNNANHPASLPSVATFSRQVGQEARCQHAGVFSLECRRRICDVRGKGRAAGGWESWSCQRRAPGSRSLAGFRAGNPANFARGQRCLELLELQEQPLCRSTCNALPGALSNSGNCSHSDNSGALCSSSIHLSFCLPAPSDPETGIWVSQFFMGG